MSGYYVIEPCQSANGVEIRLRGRRIDLAKAEAALPVLGTVVGNSGVVLLAKAGPFTLSVYGSGRVMVKAKSKPEENEVRALAEKLVAALESGGAII